MLIIIGFSNFLMYERYPVLSADWIRVIARAFTSYQMCNRFPTQFKFKRNLLSADVIEIINQRIFWLSSGFSSYDFFAFASKNNATLMKEIRK